VAAQTRIRLLELAVARLGRSAIAARLRVPAAILDDWTSGRAPLPDGMLIALIDLIDETGAP
jgi:DNA-binding transcriptional regulator YiaG